MKIKMSNKKYPKKAQRKGRKGTEEKENKKLADLVT
jgi:hypothetical protein